MVARVNNIRDQIRQDATPEEYDALINSVGDMGYQKAKSYTERERIILDQWENAAIARKAVERMVPEVDPVKEGAKAYQGFIDSCRAVGMGVK
jgi:hypothetical protein